MEIKTKAGSFELTTYTGGFPHWVTVQRDGMSISGIHHKELSDLEYAVKRLRELLKAGAKSTDPNEF